MPTLTLEHTQGTQQIEVETGANLRQTLLKNGFSPYTRWTRRVNCGGRGICATCGVWVLAPDDVGAKHWHDRAAELFGYPRLSCQITIDQDMTIRLVEDKVIWGGRDGSRARWLR